MLSNFSRIHICTYDYLLSITRTTTEGEMTTTEEEEGRDISRQIQINKSKRIPRSFCLSLELSNHSTYLISVLAQDRIHYCGGHQMLDQRQPLSNHTSQTDLQLNGEH